MTSSLLLFSFSFSLQTSHDCQEKFLKEALNYSPRLYCIDGEENSRQTSHPLRKHQLQPRFVVISDVRSNFLRFFTGRTHVYGKHFELYDLCPKVLSGNSAMYPFIPQHVDIWAPTHERFRTIELWGLQVVSQPLQHHPFPPDILLTYYSRTTSPHFTTIIIKTSMVINQKGSRTTYPNPFPSSNHDSLKMPPSIVNQNILVDEKCFHFIIFQTHFFRFIFTYMSLLVSFSLFVASDRYDSRLATVF